MKNIKFSRLFAAALVVACLALTACKPAADEDKKPSIKGTWISTFDEKYEIKGSTYNNYYTANDEFVLYFSTDSVEIVEATDETGFVFGKFNDADHIGFGATVGQWYCFYYSDLKEDSVKIYQPFKPTGKAACDSLEEAKTEYTIDNGYFDLSNPSVCKKQ